MTLRAGMVAALAAGSAAPAQEALMAQPLFDASLARVKPALSPHFHYDRSERAGCPAPTARCRRPAHLVAGDVVLIGERRGGFVFATFNDGRGHTTKGWIESTAVTPLPPATPPPAAWGGHWMADDEAEIDIAVGAGGSVSFRGNAMWGSHDPQRVRNGGVHVGEIAGSGRPAPDRFGPVAGDDGGDCRIAMRLAPPYLIVTDNLGCGGMNVSFFGVYRRTGPAESVN